MILVENRDVVPYFLVIQHEVELLSLSLPSP